jgi:hypothetical protein
LCAAAVHILEEAIEGQAEPDEYLDQSCDELLALDILVLLVKYDQLLKERPW